MNSRLYRRSVLVFALVAIGLGIAILVETIARGGGSVGYAVGALFIALGAARLTILRRT